MQGQWQPAGPRQLAKSPVLTVPERQKASEPIRNFPAVAALFADWHAREVFRAPARAT
jgi:hypothetical protein